MRKFDLALCAQLFIINTLIILYDGVFVGHTRISFHLFHFYPVYATAPSLFADDAAVAVAVATSPRAKLMICSRNEKAHRQKETNT